MTKSAKRRVIKRVIKNLKLSPKRAAKEFDNLAKTKVRWIK